MFQDKFSKLVLILFIVFLCITLGLLGYYYYLLRSPTSARNPGIQKNDVAVSGPCKNSSLKTGPSFANFETKVDNLMLLNADICFEGFENSSATIPQSYLIMRVGFNDNKGNYYSYPAKIGIVQNNGKAIAALCAPDQNKNQSCSTIPLAELPNSLKANTVMGAQINYQDNIPLLAEIKTAVETGSGFPNVNNNDPSIVEIYSLRVYQ